VEPYAQSEEYGGPGGDSVVDTDENWQRAYISYKYFSVTARDTRMPLPLALSDYPRLLRLSSPAARWLMSDWVRKDAPVFPHLEKGGWGGGRNVLLLDGSVHFLRHGEPGAFKDE
jgi:prepilin-type processing-associated H-X9-DG protein